MPYTPEEAAEAADVLIKQGFSAARYQHIQDYRKARLKKFESFSVDLLVKAEQELINFGEDVLVMLILHELKQTKP